MSVRGWLGYSRRWWGGPQFTPSPVEVVSVGADETDGASLQASRGASNAGGGFFSTVFLCAVDRDLFVERIETDSTAGVRLQFTATANPIDSGEHLRPGSHAVVTFDDFAPAAGVILPTVNALGFLAPGFLVPVGFALGVQRAAGAGTAMAAVFFYRESP